MDDLNQMPKPSDGPPSAAAKTAGGSQQSILITGLAKSGTTALFYKIKSALPPDACCLFEPRAFDASDAAGARNVLAKVILNVSDLDTFSTFTNKILIIRDPRDRLVSGTLYRVFNHPEFCSDESKVSEFIDKLRQKEASPNSISMLELIHLCDKLTGRTQMTVTDGALIKLIEFHRAHPDYFSYRYEDLVLGKFEALSRFLGVSMSNDKPNVNAGHNRVTRTRDSGDWRNWFVPEDVDYFRPLLQERMEYLGYDDDWTLSTTPIIKSDHASNYVMRLVNEYRARENRKKHKEQ